MIEEERSRPSRPTAPSPTITEQASAWDDWNASEREGEQSEPSLRQARYIEEGLKKPSAAAEVLEVGCGTGWACGLLRPYGEVIGVDLSHDVLQRAHDRYPEVTFLAGDFLTMEIPNGPFDVVVTLETLSHVADQLAFIQRIASLLKSNGRLLLATQNAPVLRERCNVPPPLPGHLRHWVDKEELRDLLEPSFIIDDLVSITPMAHKLPWRPVASWRLHSALGPVGAKLRETLERHGWGWTLMVDARFRSTPAPGSPAN